MSRRASVNRKLETPNTFDAGFTLLELLVAITLLSLLSLALLGGLRFGARVWERSDEHNLHGSQIRLAEAAIRKQIERTWPFFDASTPLNPHVLFTGRADELVFFTSSPDTSPHNGYMKVAISLEERSGLVQLVEYTGPELSDDTSSPRRRVLVDGLSELRLSYFGRTNAGHPPSWLDEWVDRTTLPDLVRIDGTLESGADHLQMTVAPRVRADVGCVYDPLTQFCRGR